MDMSMTRRQVSTLQSRYYNPEVGRFISSDVLLSTGQGVIGHNAYAYCGNNPVVRADHGGRFWETIFDIISLGASIVEVCLNPSDPWAWAGTGRRRDRPHSVCDWCRRSNFTGC